MILSRLFSRRRAIGMGVALAAGLLHRNRDAAPFDPLHSNHRPGLHPILALFRDHGHLQKIGAAYLSTFQDGPERCPAPMPLALRSISCGNETSRSELRARVQERIQDDFNAGNVVVVDGWLLSMTEVWLCTLAVDRREV